MAHRNTHYLVQERFKCQYLLSAGVHCVQGNTLCSVSGDMYDMGVSGQFSGWEEPGCIISQSKSVINRSRWKAASANCLCAVSQACLCSSFPAVYCPGNLLFMPLKADHLVLGTIEHLCAKLSECWKRENDGGKKKGVDLGKEAWRLSPLQGPSLPRVVPSCSAVTAGRS